MLPNLRKEFLKNGFVVQNMFSKQQMVLWKDKILQLQEENSVPDENDKGAKAVNSGVSVWFLDTIPEFFKYQLCNENMKYILSELYQSSKIEFLSTKPVIKTGFIEFPTPWHQDCLYWHGKEKISAWIAIDDATKENGCLKVIPESHHKIYPHLQYQECIGFDYRADNVKEEQNVTVECKKGDVIFFSDRLLHASHANTNGKDRFSMIATYRNGLIKDSSNVWNDSFVF